ncbi:hypothetical protein R5R35_012838 [Gryllus longicercus]|uniref:NADH dehydrogenase [ubiquinone] 1 alpha subcomplex subunit 1 n=1 Tax=Gryllus longicercus TaxID=2509291 RepID=A0AAN9VMM0_9ORTH
MWFEILPSYGIIVAAFIAPTVITYGINKLAYGKPFRRNLRYEFERLSYMRDERLTGNAYKVQGLEAIKP